MFIVFYCPCVVIPDTVHEELYPELFITLLFNYGWCFLNGIAMYPYHIKPFGKITYIQVYLFGVTGVKRIFVENNTNQWYNLNSKVISCISDSDV